MYKMANAWVSSCNTRLTKVGLKLKTTQLETLLISYPGNKLAKKQFSGSSCPGRIICGVIFQGGIS